MLEWILFSRKLVDPLTHEYLCSKNLEKCSHWSCASNKQECQFLSPSGCSFVSFLPYTKKCILALWQWCLVPALIWYGWDLFCWYWNLSGKLLWLISWPLSIQTAAGRKTSVRSSGRAARSSYREKPGDHLLHRTSTVDVCINVTC